MKSVLISIQPKWCEKIASGEKTIEVRKTRPKIETPFKCYIYCTKGDVRLNSSSYTRWYGGNDIVYGKHDEILNGKVIGEFVCDNIEEFESEFWDDDTYESIGKVWYEEDYGERNVSVFVDTGYGDYKSNELCREACISWEELRRYVGINFNTFYGWHISELKIYDTPKELREFKPYGYQERCGSNWFWCETCPYVDNYNDLCDKRLTRPPQSWQYIEELEAEKNG